MLNSNAPRLRRMALFLAVQFLLFLPLTNLTLGQTQPSTVPAWSSSVEPNAGHESSRSGVAGLTFALYKDEQGGTPLWLETQNAALNAELGKSALDAIAARLLCLIPGQSTYVSFIPSAFFGGR